MNKEVRNLLEDARDELKEVTTVSVSMARKVRDDQDLLDRFTDILEMVFDIREFLEEIRRNRHISDQASRFNEPMINAASRFERDVKDAISDFQRGLDATQRSR